MAYENVQFIQPNFCLGPQSGTICTIDSTNVNAVLRVKNTAGATIKDYSLSSNIVGSVVGLEYVGPRNLTSMVDGLIFFTFEKVNATTCMIKRWEVRESYSELVLKEQVIKSTSGDVYYDVIDFAVEYYQRYFTESNEKYSYLNINNTTNLKTGTCLFLGPSTDTTNLGAIETVYVSHIINYIGGERVYLTTPLKYEYAINDPITFYSHIYIYSQKGYAGDDTKGTLFKFDAYSWAPVGIDTNVIYKKITSSRWCPSLGGIASIVGTNMFFIMPYDSYLVWKSAFLNNIESDKNTMFQVYDVIFDNYTMYKLQKKITLRNDSGVLTTTSWSTYNYQQDTILPYTNSINLFQKQSVVTGYNKTIDINIKVRDQYFVGLRDVVVNLYKSGDTGASFSPTNGQATTDSNGSALVNYISGTAYNEHTLITGKASGSSSYTGSQYVWNSNNVISHPSTTPVVKLLHQLKEISNYTSALRQLDLVFKTYQSFKDDNGVWGWGTVVPAIRLFTKSYFMNLGGDWGQDTNLFYPAAVVHEWLPLLYRGVGSTDAPRIMEGNGGFEAVDGTFNQLKQVKIFSSGNTLKLVDIFYSYSSGSTSLPSINIKQPSENGSAQLSQLKLAHHTYWLGNTAYDYLWTYTNPVQFIFVEDAIPKFWSEKNTVNTYVWLRLRPYAFSLNSNSLKIWVREVSYRGDSGYIDVTSSTTMFNFDAGGGATGIELMYTPVSSFYNNSIIFIKIEVYDIATTPNIIQLDYWFGIMPDYRAPYLTNLSPSREMENISINSDIYFEIKDDATGIDINSLELLINSRLVLPTVEKVSDNYYKVRYLHSTPFYYNKPHKVIVKINDKADSINVLNDSYTFYTEQSKEVIFTAFDPSICKRGIKRFNDISLIALADGNGIDKDSINMKVFNKDVAPKVIPIIYRIS